MNFHKFKLEKAILLISRIRSNIGLTMAKNKDKYALKMNENLKDLKIQKDLHLILLMIQRVLKINQTIKIKYWLFNNL